MTTRNPLLNALSVLIGEWSVTMRHCLIPQPLSWTDTFEWLEDAFILWHWQGKNEVPSAVSVIASNENDPVNSYMLSYFDSRGVSRIYKMSFENNVWKFIRKESDFFQRFEGEFSEDGNTLIGKGEISHDGGQKWEHDYDITYTRLK